MITGQINLHMYTATMHLILGCIGFHYFTFFFLVCSHTAIERALSNPFQEFILTNMIPSVGAEPFSRAYSQSS
jgi:hypothetical protein|uniref:Uncharacterized protein n=1 Tax=Populus trichocarpa TaxID=3694 RepID=U5FIH0_POPTR